MQDRDSSIQDQDAPIRIAVIGSGPAGFYAAGHLLKEREPLIEVDMIERLPTPWGLVRSGVAPDHPKIKSVSRVYEKTAAHPRFRFFGHIELGADVSREELAAHYHALVYATGAPTDRALGIPGEDLRGSWPATDFVGWYNGHPDNRDLGLELACERAVVIGNGNVALDVARMLVLSGGELAPTDTADHALERLALSSVREIVIVGRRGPEQAAFTNPELRELGELADADVIVDAEELERAAALSDPSADSRVRTNLEILRAYAAQPPRGLPRRIVLRFLLSPVEILGDGRGQVTALRLAANDLVASPDGSLRARPRPGVEPETLAAGLVLRAIGYRGRPLEGVPFDEARGVILNAAGRVIDHDGSRRPGEYAVGWVKRGPTGVIGTNKKDAQETVDAILEDIAEGRLPEPSAPDGEAVRELLYRRKPDLVTYEGWARIDAHERRSGEPAGRPRVKLTRIEELLAVAAAESPGNGQAPDHRATAGLPSARP